MKVGAVGIANNHALDFREKALDFGEKALDDTLEVLKDAGIAAAGAGFGHDAAYAAAVVPAADLRVGLVAVTDHPAEYLAAPERWGARSRACSMTLRPCC